MTQHMLTTIDNPWSPVTQWDEWLAYDTMAGHGTPSLLARVASSSDDMSEADQDAVREQAIRTICEELGPGFYIMVDAEPERVSKV